MIGNLDYFQENFKRISEFRHCKVVVLMSSFNDSNEENIWSIIFIPLNRGVNANLTIVLGMVKVYTAYFVFVCLLLKTTRVPVVYLVLSL